MRTRQQKQVLLMRMLACASHLFRSYPIARVKRDPLQGGLVPVGATCVEHVGSDRRSDGEPLPRERNGLAEAAERAR